MNSMSPESEVDGDLFVVELLPETDPDLLDLPRETTFIMGSRSTKCVERVNPLD